MPVILVVLIALLAAAGVEVIRRSRVGSHFDHDLRLAFQDQRVEPMTVVVDRAA